MPKECRACGKLVKDTVVSSDGDSWMCVECWNGLFINDPRKRVTVEVTTAADNGKRRFLPVAHGDELEMSVDR